jgi:hypothetical protein
MRQALKLFVKRMENSTELSIYDGNDMQLPCIENIVIESPAGAMPRMVVTFILGDDYILIDSTVDKKSSK